MKAVRRLCAVLVGLVFFVAGILKLMDPVGAGLVVESQLRFLHLGFLAPLAGFLGFGFALADALLGIALLAGVWKKMVSRMTFCLLSFYTVLTLILLIFNPSINCGCFGEAFPLTHLQSFVKNIVLLALLLASFRPFGGRRSGNDSGSDGDGFAGSGCGAGKVVAFAAVSVCVVFFSVYSLLALPLIDYTPLAPGAEFSPREDPEVMAPSELDRYFDEDSEKWAELYFTDAEGGYADSLLNEGNVVIISVYQPSRVSDRGWSRIAESVATATKAGALPLVLVSCAPEDLVYYNPGSSVLSNIYFADRRSLLTLNRSNAGVTLVSDGQVVRKWPSYSTPSLDEISKIGDPTEVVMSQIHRGSFFLQAFIIYASALLLLL